MGSVVFISTLLLFQAMPYAAHADGSQGGYTRIVRNGHRLVKGAKLRVRGLVLKGGAIRASVVTVLR